MGEPARKPWMTVAEFLTWDDGTDTRYELVDGQPVAMAPAMTFHNKIVGNAATAIDKRLALRPPCSIEPQGGILVDDLTYYIADVAATCSMSTNQPFTVDPFLLVEVLSPSTRAFDLQIKVKRYSRLPSVREIWLVDSERRWVQVWARAGDAWIVRILEAGEDFDSQALGDRIALDELYRNVELTEPEQPPREAAS